MNGSFLTIFNVLIESLTKKGRYKHNRSIRVRVGQNERKGERKLDANLRVRPKLRVVE